MKKVYLAYFLVFILIFTLGCTEKAPKEETSKEVSDIKENKGIQLVIHYYRYDEEYKNWNFWVWAEGNEGKAYQITDQDDFGKFAVVQLEEGVTRVGLIPRLGDWEEKDVNKDRFINLKGNATEVWLIQGTEEIYYSKAEANNKPKIASAFLDAKREIVAELSGFINFTGESDENFSVQADNQPLGIKEVNPLTIKQGNSRTQGYETLVKDTKIQFVYSPVDWGYTPKDHESVYVVGNFNDFKKNPDYKMEFDKVLGIYKLTKDLGSGSGVTYGQKLNFLVYKDNQEVFRLSKDLSIDKFAGKSAKLFQIILDNDIELSTSIIVQHKDFGERKVAMRNILESEEFTYSGNDLGANYGRESTVFKVWSPVAEDMKVVIYSNYDSAEGQTYSMNQAKQGIWELKLPGDLKNQYYNYRVTIDGVERETVDPYAKGATANGEKGMVVDFASINADGWGSQRIPKPLKSTESILYEMHVRDFSLDQNSGIKNKGKYLAFTEKGTKGADGVSTGLDHLKELGITHLHLLPVYDFASIDETKQGQYNWGYDPFLYNVPEGSYSTNPYDGTVRICEFKYMVKTLHENDIRVVMDVVFNHTFKTGDSPFDILVPKYYYRTDKSGNYTNGSGCGNETASEKSMMRKFIVDSVKFWATEYKIDGFRFDLMALHDIETMQEVERELRKINPNILIYGEPWTGGTSALNPTLQLKKGAQKGLNIAVFNDDIRNAIKGDNDGIGLGFVNGGSGLENEVKKGIVGSIQYESDIQGFTEQPIETINYVSSHDNLTLFDKLEKSNPNISDQEREKMNRLALSIVLTSEGVPFIQGGTEMLRTKNGEHNSFNAGDNINQIAWARKHTYSKTYNYIKNLIDLRKSQRVLTLDNAKDIKESLSFLDSPKNTVGYLLNSSFKGDYKHMVIIHNANRDAAIVKLPMSGQWKVLANEFEVNKAGVSIGKAAFSGEVEVAPISTYILYKN